MTRWDDDVLLNFHGTQAAREVKTESISLDSTVFHHVLVLVGVTMLKMATSGHYVICCCFLLLER